MDRIDEKDGERDRMDDVPEEDSPIEASPRDPEKQGSSDPEKDIAPLRRPRVPPTGTDRDKHLSLESAADKYKRESVEASCPRCSTISTQTLQTDADGQYIDPGNGDADIDDQRHPRFLAPGSMEVSRPGLFNSMEINRPAAHRGLTAASATTVGAASRRSLPSLRRKETKLAQKEAHPW